MASRADRVTRVRPAPTYVDVMFKETRVGSMLRTLCARGESGMAQAEFMDLYHLRCDRPERVCQRCFGTLIRYEYARNFSGVFGPYRAVVPEEVCNRCQGSGKAQESRSSFGNNFGRFVYEELRWRNGKEQWYSVPGPMRCIKQWTPQPGRVRREQEHPCNWLYWSPPSWRDIVRTLTDIQLTRAENTMERIFIAESHPSRYGAGQIVGDNMENVVWLKAMRAEMARRSGFVGMRAA
jgi:hypothetical protein